MNYKTEPFHHQAKSLELAKDKQYWGHFHEMGAGKTKIVIDNANYLFDKGEIDAVLVVAPNGIHTNWAEKELPAHSYEEPSIYNWKGRPNSLKAKRELNNFMTCDRNFQWFCINIEAIRTAAGFEACEEFLRKYRCMMVVDESTIIKTPRAKQTKAAIHLGGLAFYRRILTGTPITQGPLDFYSQCKFLDRGSIPFTSFTAFRNTFSIERQIILNSGKRFNQVVGYTKLGYLKRIIEPFSDRILKSKCLDLPEKLYQTVEVQMHKEQELLYKQMKELYVARLGEQESATGMVTAQNILTVMMKLQQIVSGFLIDDENVIHELPNNRLQALDDIVSGFTGKAIIWCAFRQNIHSVCEYLKDKYGAGSVVDYFGDTSREGRTAAINRFQNDPECRFFVSNKTGAEGITLTAAQYSIYFSNTYSLHTRLQSEDRNHRIGQDKNVTYVDLYSPRTVDQKILTALKAKKDIADEVLTNWRDLL